MAELETLWAKVKAEAEGRPGAAKNEEEPQEAAPEVTQRRRQAVQEEIFVAPARGGRWHTRASCSGLREAKEVKELTPCRLCARHLCAAKPD